MVSKCGMSAVAHSGPDARVRLVPKADIETLNQGKGTP